MSRSRHFCFTLNNYSADAECKLKALDCRYLIYGKETGESGTAHLQGYVSFVKALRFNLVKKLLPAGCHIEAAKGSAQQNTDYCSKDNDVFTKGIMPAAGARNDIKEFVKLIRSGKTDNQLIDENPGYCARYTRFITFVRNAKLQEENKAFKPIKVTVYVGDNEKIMEKAYADHPNLYEYTYFFGDWFCGYVGQKTLFIRNFTGQIQKDIFQGLISGYPLKLPVKGAYTYKAWDNVIISSPTHPEDWDAYPWSTISEKINEVITLSQ